jgi:hypothetical protein
MDINSQHQNLLGNQISPKSEDFCILAVIRSVWQLLGFKMAAVAMETKVQNGHQIQKSSDLGEIWLPSRL